MAEQGSDLHLKAGSPPKIRQGDGRLVPLDHASLSHEESEAIARTIIPEDRSERFHSAGEVDFAYGVPGVGRFRANVFRQRGSTSMVLRRLRFGGPTFEELHLPEVVRKLAEEPRGLVLVTGPTGSGKTTTLAAMIEHINGTKQAHIVTVEDPIEVLFRDDEASINQREVGNDTESFQSALRAALRQDPDVILIGEMRDTETVRAALQAAETGHLVLSTLHTVDATETVNRVLDFFPPHQQQQIRLTLAGALRGIICQRLVQTVDGGRTPGVEIMVNTGRIAERIADPDKTSEIHELIAEGRLLRHGHVRPVPGPAGDVGRGGRSGRSGDVVVAARLPADVAAGRRGALRDGLSRSAPRGQPLRVHGLGDPDDRLPGEIAGDAVGPAPILRSGRPGHLGERAALGRVRGDGRGPRGELERDRAGAAPEPSLAVQDAERPAAVRCPGDGEAELAGRASAPGPGGERVRRQARPFGQSGGRAPRRG